MFFAHPNVRRDFSVVLSGLGFERCMLATRFAGGYYCFAPLELLIWIYYYQKDPND